MLKPGALYQIYEYPKTSNFKRQVKARRACEVYVIFDKLDKNGLALCEVIAYHERPGFLPGLRKGLKLYLPAHFLRPPNFMPKIAEKQPQRWMTMMEQELKKHLAKVPQEQIKAAIDVVAAPKLVKPSTYQLLPKQNWVSKAKRKRVSITSVGVEVVKFKEGRRAKSMDRESFLEYLKDQQFLLEVPQDDILTKIMTIVKPYLPAFMVSLLATWLIKRLGEFSKVEGAVMPEGDWILAHLDEDLKDICDEWYDVIQKANSYEEMTDLMNVLLKTEGLEDSQKMYCWQYFNYLRHNAGLKRL